MEYKYIGGIFTSMIKEELEIVTIRELLNKDESNGKLKIPEYQRLTKHLKRKLKSIEWGL